MTNNLLAKKGILQGSCLFDSEYLTGTHYQTSDGQNSVAAEVQFLSEKSMWKIGTSGLFNGGYYEFGSSDLHDLAYPSIIHYITNGYFEGRRPSALVDVDYIVSQIAEAPMPEDEVSRHQLKLDVLKGYSGIDELLRVTGANPNRLFDNAYFLETNRLDSDDIDLPIVFYYRHKGYNPETQKPLETTMLFSMSDYLAKNHDIVEADVNPLEHLLTYGLSEKRLNCIRDLVSDTFLSNTADLYNEPAYRTHEYFLLSSMSSGQIAGPCWHSQFKTAGHQALQYDSSKVHGSSVTIGTVLYNNSEEELLRLKSSIDKEKESNDDVSLNDIYFVNCTDNFDMYERIFGNDKIIRSEEGNIGFGSGHNCLMKIAFAESDYYFGVNPDGYLIRDCVKSLVSFSRFHEDDSLIEANTLPVNHPKWHDPVRFDTKWVSGVAFFVPKRVWSDVGGFDEEIHMYCEDVDFSWRVRAAGYGLKVCPTASFFHDVTPRFLEELPESETKHRRKAMLTGAYHLSMKWGSDKHAAEYHKTLIAEGLLLPNQTIKPPTHRVPASICSEVADFSHGLRFAPSRFW